ncbi:MAG: hypothetical protein A2358_02385 [Candidatus Staskawiczbacteria bacterium RIFOXYB1_FULL_37_44]|uniref:Uncharacterized protein n=1 Tax=Candidatus Staskawiczbacteria bacterium RIFOXYB1_FULL_37_44 TaxID=1802223 RepID=A0A1G2ITF0_9BACT|nr:MAG: hypothetical protein A2358_02385 [Candidatus Staskawiczbacteria bacterium RIFOXYB1_FULL_37_44]OGZ82835.1 MAG: hypothetical protein A2416_03365 [Candidatus Staskawiczbacteria bacterium RIFOXYC1_FULL_37_52]OGZ87428.1 MAG: hypothetical protein A2444_00975 [Candidatus Staskawiczbacteria bacterium RIFOXYC2_FULL_37_19]OGZ89122.1 MAG: hypothetical protein A2581_01245 [Candidatus Staskawiczbacteria bacterium RIFOXYD1_FULL_37_110]
MFYKNWPYWLKGGIILDLLIIIAFLIYRFFSIFSSLLILEILFPSTLLIRELSIKCFLAGYMGDRSICPISLQTFQIILLISSIIFYFIVGAIIGLIYGKIKNKSNIIKK